MDDQGKDAWNTALESFEDATFYHRFEWRTVIEKHFGFQPLYLYIQEAGHITGLLPLYLVRGLLIRKALVSLPLCVYGGIVAVSGEHARALAEEAIRQAEKCRVDYIELRSFGPAGPDWVDDNRYATFRKKLADNDDANMKAIPRKQRAEIRKAQALGLKSRISTDIEPFFTQYATSMRNLGTPVFSRSYYRTLLDTFAGECDVLTVYSDNKPLSSVLNFYFRDQVLPFYGGGIPEARPANAYPFMYWELMRHAVAKGRTMFDFGRSMRDSGAFFFKKNFGFTAEPLHYQRRLVRGRSLPNPDPNQPVYRAAIGIWKKLPLPVANRLGPWVAKTVV